jgi:hypothetical protein
LKQASQEEKRMVDQMAERLRMSEKKGEELK